MTLTRKDLTATLLTTLAVLAFFATHEGWNVWLIGDSHRWAAGAIMVLGSMTLRTRLAEQEASDEAPRRSRHRSACAGRPGNCDGLVDAAFAARRRHRRPLGGLDVPPRLAGLASTGACLIGV